jgi:male-specific lethal 1
MEKRVEESMCVVLCVSERYRQSASCQAEAQYAKRLKKPVVSLIMQHGYENIKGWLGEVIKNGPQVNFYTHSFKDAVRQVRQELVSISSERQAGTGTAAVTVNDVRLLSSYDPLLPGSARSETNRTSPRQAKPVQWTEEQVKVWFLTNNINVNIYNMIFPCSGSILKQM